MWISQYEIAAPLRQTGARSSAALRIKEIHRKGSHVKMKHQDGRVIVFPYHDEVDRYTLRGALRDAEIDEREFFNQL